MAQQISNSFTEYSFTQEEYHSAVILSDLQYQLIMTSRAQIAQQKLNLKATDDDFNTQWVYLSGQMDVLTSMLDASDTVKANLLAEAMSKAAAEAEQQSRNPGSTNN